MILKSAFLTLLLNAAVNAVEPDKVTARYCDQVLDFRVLLAQPDFVYAHRIMGLAKYEGRLYIKITYNVENKIPPFNNGTVEFIRKRPKLAKRLGLLLRPKEGVMLVATTQTLNDLLENPRARAAFSGVRFQDVSSGKEPFANEIYIDLLAQGLHGFATYGSWFYHDHFGAHVFGAVFMPKMIFEAIKARANFLSRLRRSRAAQKNPAFMAAILSQNKLIGDYWDKQTAALGNIIEHVGSRAYLHDLSMLGYDLVNANLWKSLDSWQILSTQFAADNTVSAAIRRAARAQPPVYLNSEAPTRLFDNIRQILLPEDATQSI
ncbi:MAG: hypothetical protein AB7N80_02585 [Bdellovibrionales bacterium]